MYMHAPDHSAECDFPECKHPVRLHIVGHNKRTAAEVACHSTCYIHPGYVTSLFLSSGLFYTIQSLPSLN